MKCWRNRDLFNKNIVQIVKELASQETISSRRAEFLASNVSKLGQLLVSGEETADVIIECENREFKCHRVVLAASSDYFHKLFDGQFGDRSDPKVVLREISASTFEAVLKFVYTGGDTVSINFSNICPLLRASEFFLMPEMQEECIRFVKQNRLCVRSTFELFRFACTKKKQPLMDVLSEDISMQFRIFCRSDEFLELSFDELNVLLNKWKSTKKLMSEAKLILYSVCRWINHDRQNRRCYHSGNFSQIPQVEDFGSFRMMLERDGPITTQLETTDILDVKINDIVKPIGLDDVTETTREKVPEMNLKHLNVFVQCPEENVVRVFGLHNIWCGWDISGKITNTRVCNQNLRSVALDDDHLLCMHFPRQSCAPNTWNPDQSFCLYDSVYLRKPVELRNPPVIFEDLALCSFEKKIYAFNKSQSVRRRELNSTTSDLSSYVLLSDEAIRRGMFTYESHLDHWFPMPAMEKEFYPCCATFCQRTLFAFGSDHPYEPDTAKSSIQVRAYDHRSKKWENFADQPLWHSAATDCCVNYLHPDRIFLHTQAQCVFSFDIVAGRWESPTRRKAFHLNEQVQYGRLISFYDRIWALPVGSSAANQEHSELTSEELWCRGSWEGNFDRSPWSISYELTRSAENASGKTRGIVLDVVVFKSGPERS